MNKMMKKQHLFLKIIINLKIITFLFRFLINKFFINIKTDEYFEMIYKNLTFLNESTRLYYNTFAYI